VRIKNGTTNAAPAVNARMGTAFNQTQAFPLMEKFLDDFHDAELICVPSSSCVSTIRDHYPVMAAKSETTDFFMLIV